MEYQDPRELLVAIARELNGEKIPYFVTGGMAVFVWGRPRFTADIDIVVQLKERDIAGLLEVLRGLTKINYIDESALRRGLLQGGGFNFIDGVSGIKADFLLPPPEDKNAELEFKRRVVKDIGGEKVYFISPEDLILRKAIWYRESESSKQLEDIKSIFKNSGKNLDRVYLKKLAEKLDVLEILERCS